MGELRDRMIQAMVLRHFADKTQEAYLRVVTDLARHYHKPPDRVSAAEIEAYLAQLRTERGLSWSTVLVSFHALRFFYKRALGRRNFRFYLKGQATESRLPELLNRDELERLFQAATYPKHRALLVTAYGAGLRVGELVRLKLTDIDSRRMTIRVEQGKRRRDRYTVLSPRLLEELRDY
jgi:integrase/recombinase XerD